MPLARNAFARHFVELACRSLCVPEEDGKMSENLVDRYWPLIIVAYLVAIGVGVALGHWT
jgi:hypothetical protein